MGTNSILAALCKYSGCYHNSGRKQIGVKLNDFPGPLIIWEEMRRPDILIAPVKDVLFRVDGPLHDGLDQLGPEIAAKY